MTVATKFWATEDLVEHAAGPVLLDVIEVDPHAAVVGEQPSDLVQPVAQHGQPHRVLDGVVVVGERLPGVERRVDVDQLHLADVGLGQVRQRRQRRQGMQSVAVHQEVAFGLVTDVGYWGQQAHL
ncbi:hypothetical protein JKP75_13285 [Blastococcus sp. TML/M2B]|nr:hypothetical protein [Blastococcus sp. TML/M2B]MBN1093451.1 hypothetical protein [Blastococcus sp. TML/M2B]